MAKWSFGVLYLLSLVVPAIAWKLNHGTFADLDAASLKLVWCRLAGLWAVIVILWQFLFISRAKWLEQTFGLDRLTRFHHFNGFLAVVCLLMHGSLATLGHAGKADLTTWEQAVDFWKVWNFLPAAMIGQGLFFLVVISSLGFIRKRFSYETWHWSHFLGYLAMGLAFGHQITKGKDFVTHDNLRHLWTGFQFLVVATLLWGRTFLPIFRYFRYSFRVERVVRETDDVTSVYIKAERLAGLAPRGGQFVLVRFVAKGFWSEAHPFSLSQPPHGDTLRLTIKKLGDFTARIPELSPGTRVMIDGPHGIFTAERARGKKILLIAGGIGITPLRSILEDLLSKDCQVTLLYTNRQEKGIVLRGELESYTANPNFRLIHILSNDEAWQGEKGILDEEKIKRLVSDVFDREVFLCGPPPMMAGVRRILVNLGVPSHNIYDERFAL